MAIEHVGSTAIPGMAAKPIIDFGVALRAFEDALYCITPLVEIGYDCLGEFGIPRRIYFRKRTDTPLPGQSPGEGAGRTHQIHIYEQNHEQFVNHLVFRDYLRAHPDAAREYEALKRRLAAEHSNVEAYAGREVRFCAAWGVADCCLDTSSRLPQSCRYDAPARRWSCRHIRL